MIGERGAPRISEAMSWAAGLCGRRRDLRLHVRVRQERRGALGAAIAATEREMPANGEIWDGALAQDKRADAVTYRPRVVRPPELSHALTAYRVDDLGAPRRGSVGLGDDSSIQGRSARRCALSPWLNVQPARGSLGRLLICG
jgi:hypothetical protein